MYPISSEGLNRETDEYVYFFTPVFYPLDNFSAHTVDVWGVVFPTAEHAFQWKKFSVTKPNVAQDILTAPSPEAVKRISNAHKLDQPSDWLTVKASIMEEILRAKAEQHDDVREALRRTGKRIIAENSPVDSFWGIGLNGSGKNVLGKLWMKIREELPNG